MTGLATAPVIAESLCGDVICEQVNGRSTFTRLYSRSPIKLLSPSPVGSAARVVCSSFGGGMVAGDEVPVRIVVGDSAACVFTTQSSSKVYRSDGRVCSQSLEATLGSDSVFVSIPDPLCCFAGASFRQRQRFNLEETSNLVWLDWITSGRWARDERWEFDSLSTRTDISIAGRLRLRETLYLDASDGPIDSAMRMGRFDCYAVLAIAGPKLQNMIEIAQATVNDLTPASESGLLASASQFNGGSIIRVAGPRAEVVQKWLATIISSLALVIGGDPWARKW